MCEDGEEPAGEPDGDTGAVGALGDSGAGWAGGGIGLGSGCWAPSAGEKKRVAASAGNANDAFVNGANRLFVAMSFLPVLLTDY